MHLESLRFVRASRHYGFKSRTFQQNSGYGNIARSLPPTLERADSALAMEVTPLAGSDIAESTLGVVFPVQFLNCELNQLRIVFFQPHAQ